jgi:MT0933-like antitoxin protein
MGTSELRSTPAALTDRDDTIDRRPIPDQRGPDMATLKKLAALAAAAEAARRYARKNPDKAGKFVDQAAGFVDKQTKGKYTRHIDGAARTAKGVAGIPTTGTGTGTGAAATGTSTGTTQGFETSAGSGTHPGDGASAPGQSSPPPARPS